MAETKEAPKPKRFPETLAELDDGEIVNRLDKELTELNAQIFECALSKGNAGTAKGTITLKLSIAIDAHGEMAIAAETSHKAPKIPNAITRRWLDPKTSQIVNRNPRQPDLPLRDGLGGTVTNMRSV